jgi:hypothetical protein
MADLVECHSEIEYPERPIAIFPQGKRLEIDRILSCWRTPDGKWFRVIAEDGEVYELSYNELSDEWLIHTGLSYHVDSYKKLTKENT